LSRTRAFLGDAGECPDLEIGMTLHDAGDSIESSVSGIRGAVLRPEDSGYNEARSVWNGMIDCHA
jgi:hypothetical protein